MGPTILPTTMGRGRRVRGAFDRKQERGSSRSRSRGADDRLSEGDKVEADYRGRGKFYPAKSRGTAATTPTTFEDDGERDDSDKDDPKRRGLELVREGDKVEADYRGRASSTPVKLVGTGGRHVRYRL